MRERKHRLPNSAYKGLVTASFTVCVAQRKLAFTSPGIVNELVTLLADSLERRRCVAPIYCFMPDHLHVLARGTTETSSVKDAMDGFKWASSKWLGMNAPEFELQKDYHDHVIRSNEDWKSHAAYILCNPIRAGLVEDPFEFPFTGSIGFELPDVIGEIW